VIFLSDHGMAFPFAKSNVYLQSTRTPWIMRWPGRIKSGQVSDDMISAIDILPTALDAAGIDVPSMVDGQSLLPLLDGVRQSGRDLVFTQFYELINRKPYPMLAVQDRRYGYLFNPWTDGETVFRNESCSGRTFKAMVEAAKEDDAIAARVDLFKFRVLEEFYDFEKDPAALNNLVDDPKHQAQVNRLRAELRRWMEETDNSLLAVFDHRDSQSERKRLIAQGDE
jgi:N-sulfoglucosamine sulfohydrolase